jgi:hypothetical protein
LEKTPYPEIEWWKQVMKNKPKPPPYPPSQGVLPSAGAKSRKRSKREWILHSRQWIGALKDDRTAGADMDLILRERRRHI